MFNKVKGNRFVLDSGVSTSVYHHARATVIALIGNSNVDSVMLDRTIKELVALKVANLVDDNIKAELVSNGYLVVNVGTELHIDVTIGVHNDKLVYGVYEI